jgi:hypothetical protein
MKSIFSVLLAFCMAASVSCTNHEVTRQPENFIQADIGGTSMKYSQLVTDQHVIATNYKFAEFQFRDTDDNCKTWTMVINNVDLGKASYPLTLSGNSGPEFNMTINKTCLYTTALLDQLTNFQNDTKLTITSFKDQLMVGEFSGTGQLGKITGSFRVKLNLKEF